MRYTGYMSTQEDADRLELLQGTLDLLILRTLIFGSQHGQGIARAIQQTSDEELLVEHGALYPALQRLEERHWISAKWGISTNNRKARFYSLTPAGRKQLGKETTKWKRLAAAIGRILESEGG
jgi:transcriptional regulator